jgi:dynein heavy chain
MHACRFQKWPSDALGAVAFKFLKEMDLKDDVRTQLVGLCQQVHEKIGEASQVRRKGRGRRRRGSGASTEEQGTRGRTPHTTEQASERAASQSFYPSRAA